MKSAFQIFIGFHGWMACCAVFAYLATSSLYGLPFDLPLAGLLFLATVAEYNLRPTTFRILRSGNFNKLKAPEILALAALLAIFPILPMLNVAQFFFFFHLGLLALGYVLPVLPNKLSLRQIPYLKIGLIVYAWVGCTLVLPFLANYSFPPASALIERSSFFLALALCFDLRDLTTDRQAGLATIPTSLGIGRSQQMIGALWVLGLGMGLWLGGGLPLLFAYLLCAPLMLGTTPGPKSDRFRFWLDGTLAIQAGCLMFL